MKINLLTADVFNRIAAGEVVDRPYSVVKELVENAIDAGARQITIEADGGGKKCIRVSDDGCGIEKEDLKSAFLPHATSKLRTAEDLEHIATLGFRGEAVASIAAVSRMKIVSKTEEGEAYSLCVEGGVFGEVQKDGGSNGTCVTVEDLFYNTPARLKFLKSDGQEEADISAMVVRFILSRPEIAFTYFVNGKVKYRSFGDGLRSALAVVYGADILEKCYEIAADKHGIRLKGVIGNPDFSKPTRGYQSLFVNGRYVVNQTVSAAITNAYGAYLMKRQFPFYVLFLDVPSEIVDVNVHPNKTDVRFADNQIIYGSVYHVVSAVLDGNARALEYIVKEERGATVPVSPAIEEKIEEKPLVQEVVKERVQMTYEEAKKELQFEIPLTSNTVRRDPFTPVMMQVRSSAPKEEDFFEENKKFLEELERKAEQQKIDPATLEFKGELFHTYLIYEKGDEAYLVDQHAAHERLIYDKLRKQCDERTVLSQPMLVPYVLEVNAQEYAFLEEKLPLIRELGFEIDEFGGHSFRVSSVPSDLQSINLKSFFDEILTQSETLRSIRLADLLKDKLASAACKAAVKGGYSLTQEEVYSLLERMGGDMGLKCPHGRPVAVKLMRTEVEKLFKRIVS